MKHYAFGTVVAALLLAAPTANATHVAPLGGALVAINGFFDTDQNLSEIGNELLGFEFSIEGAFFAETNISDTSTPQNFIASADIGFNGSPVFSGSAETGPLVIDDILSAAFTIFAPAVTLIAPTPPANFAGSFDFASINFGFLGLSPDQSLLDILPTVSFAIDVTGFTANSVMGTFLLDTSIDLALIELIGLGAPPEQGSFDAVLSISPVQAVPVPAALPLALTGAALLGGLGWRKRRKAALAA